MEAKKAKMVAAALRSLLSNTTEATAVTITVVIDKEREDGSSVEIAPKRTNTTGTFFHAEELVDVCRAFCVSEWVGATLNSEGEPIAIAHIY